MKKTSLACMLAALMFSVPAAACTYENNASRETALPEQIEPIVPERPSEAPQETPAEIPNEAPAEPPAEQPAPSEEEPKPEPPVSAPAPADPVLPEKTEYLKTLADGLTVRSGAGASYQSLGSVEKGILMKYAGRTGNWFITAYRGKKAYVSANYAKIVTMNLAGERTEAVIGKGLDLLGTPYVYGAVRLHDGNGNFLKGFTTAKFDCSSLMQYIFFEGANINLNVTTRTQVSQGRAVPKADLRRGDLLFFTNASRKNNTGIERVGHVALYLGENYILHTASDYAKIEQISSLRWSYFITARRML